jgi:hypothetical protein
MEQRMSKNSDYQLEQPIFHDDLDSASLTNEYIKQKRDELVESTQSRLEVLDHEMARLDQQARESSDEIRANWLVTRTDLARHRRLAWEQLERLRSHDAEPWSQETYVLDDARQNFSAAISEARKQLRRAR